VRHPSNNKISTTRSSDIGIFYFPTFTGNNRPRQWGSCCLQIGILSQGSDLVGEATLKWHRPRQWGSCCLQIGIPSQGSDLVGEATPKRHRCRRWGICCLQIGIPSQGVDLVGEAPPKRQNLIGGQLLPSNRHSFSGFRPRR